MTPELAANYNKKNTNTYCYYWMELADLPVSLILS